MPPDEEVYDRMRISSRMTPAQDLGGDFLNIHKTPRRTCGSTSQPSPTLATTSMPGSVPSRGGEGETPAGAAVVPRRHRRSRRCEPASHRGRSSTRRRGGTCEGLRKPPR